MSTLIARRRGDLLLSIVQKNSEENVLIAEANDALLELVGYSIDELKNNCTFKIFSDDDKSRILRHLEYEEYGIDVESILSKMGTLKLKSKSGHLIPVKVKVFASNSTSSKEKRFELLAREYSCIDHLLEFRRKCNNFEYSYNSFLRILDQSSTKDELVLLSAFCREYNKECVIACIEPSEKTQGAILQAINIIKRTIRSTDQIDHINDVIILFIVDCHPSDAEKPLSRIMSKIMPVDQDVKIRYFSIKNKAAIDVDNLNLEQAQIFKP